MSHSEHLSHVPGIQEDTLLAAASLPNAASVLRPISGLYEGGSPAVLPAGGHDTDHAPLEVPGGADARTREELRLDVDGNDPQMVASGTVFRALNSRVDWVAKLAPESPNTWTGTVWFKDGDLGVLPYTNVKIQALRSGSMMPQAALVIFSGGGAPNAERRFEYRSPYFRQVEFEFDQVAGVTAGMQIDTHAHPNRPASLPAEILTIPRIFERAGFDVQLTTPGTVPMLGAGANAQWSDMEMHDAMQAHWSRFDEKPAWALWVFHAALHEEGTGLGGIMFDDIGANHRQGTAIFTESFISRPPAGDPAGSAWVERMRLWCACHEMGHAFNLAHSWQKALGTPWIPLANAPEARSFMNYPYHVLGGQTAFFSNFHYRFSNDELLFMRHAPERLIQMGNAEWFDNHAFRQAKVLAEPTFNLELRVQRAVTEGVQRAAAFEFLEPVVLELKLTNVSGRPQVVPDKLLAASHHLTVIVKRHRHNAREIVPFATYCWEPTFHALAHGESVYESLFSSVGQGGWHIAEPGYYTVQVALHTASEDVVSNPLVIRVSPPRSYEEEYLAQDFFSDDVARVLSFDGSRVMTSASEALQEVVDQLPNRSVAMHARMAQASALMCQYKEFTPSAYEPKFEARPARPEEATAMLASVIEQPTSAAAVLGNIDLNHYLSRLSKSLVEAGDSEQAGEVLGALANALTERKALPSVVQGIKDRHAAIQPEKRATTRRSAAGKEQGKRP